MLTLKDFIIRKMSSSESDNDIDLNPHYFRLKLQLNFAIPSKMPFECP